MKQGNGFNDSNQLYKTLHILICKALVLKSCIYLRCL